MGAGRRLRESNPHVKLIGLQPHKDTSIQGLKNMEVSLTPEIFNEGFLDETRYVKQKDAAEMVSKLAMLEGLFVGFSSGAAMHGALELAKELKHGTIVTIFPDSGYKYLSNL
jgi:cysteine synthase B